MGNLNPEPLGGPAERDWVEVTILVHIDFKGMWSNWKNNQLVTLKDVGSSPSKPVSAKAEWRPLNNPESNYLLWTLKKKNLTFITLAWFTKGETSPGLTMVNSWPVPKVDEVLGKPEALSLEG